MKKLFCLFAVCVIFSISSSGAGVSISDISKDISSGAVSVADNLRPGICISCSGNYVDLTITQLTASNNAPVIGDMVEFSATIKNGGNIKSNSSITAGYQDDAQITTGSTSSIDPGKSAIVKYKWECTTPGTYTIKAKADATNTNNEWCNCNENNNEKSVSVTCSKKPIGMSCTSPSECESGKCYGGTCKPGTICTGDSECESGKYCEGETCKDKKTDSMPCTASNQCSSSYCSNNFCCASGTCCGSDSDCSLTQTCISSTHQCQNLNCPAGQKAENHQCSFIPGYCASSSNCSENESCVNNLCTALNCPAGQHAQNHQCSAVSGYCTSSDNCKDNENCNNSKCTALTCSAGQQAQNHQCQTQTQTGTSAGELPVALIAFAAVFIIIIAVMVFLWIKPSRLDLSANPEDMPADGKSASTIIITVKNIFGKALSSKKDINLTISSTGGKIPDKAAIRKGSTSATAVLTSSTTPGTVKISASAENLSGSADVTFRASAKRYCMHCGAQMVSDVDPCPRCGKLPPSGVDTKNCPNCNAVIPSIAKFCKVCGAGQPN